MLVGRLPFWLPCLEEAGCSGQIRQIQIRQILLTYINNNDKGSMTGDNFSVFRFNGDDTKWYEESKVKINNNEYC